MEEKESDYIPPEREEQVAQLAKSVSNEEDDISDDEVTEKEMSKVRTCIVDQILENLPSTPQEANKMK